MEVLQQATLEDLINFFDTYISPSSTQRRKLSIHLASQLLPSTGSTDKSKTSPRRFSVAASEEFLAVLKKHGIPTEDEALYRSLSKAEPPIQAVKAFWIDYLKKFSEADVSRETKEVILGSIDELARRHPRKEEGEEEAGKSAAAAVVKVGVEPVVIRDIPTFKARLSLGPAAVPVFDLDPTQALV